MQTPTFAISAAAVAMVLAMAVGCTRQNGQEQDAEQPNAADDLRITGVVFDVGLAELCDVDSTRAHFEYDSAELDADAQATVEQLANCLDEGPLAGQSIAVVGHADPRGPDDYNRELGMTRAESVADVLARNGVPSDRIQVESAGEARAHETPELWPIDRRVDIRVVGN
jgi:outer membrane protein OmpA-like peptidoglycan-associated protein